MPKQARISTQILVPVVDHAASKGLDARPWLSGRGLGPDALADVERMVPLADYIRFMEWAAERLGDPFFGLHAAESGDAGALGALSFLFMSAPTLREAFGGFIQYLSVLQEATRLMLEPDQGGVRFVYQLEDGRIFPRRQDAEYSIASMFQLINRYLAGRFRPREIYFEHDRAGAYAAYAQYFGCEVFFRQPTNAIVFDHDVLAARSPRLSTRLYGLISAQLSAAMQARDQPTDWSTRVRRALTEERLAASTKIADIAAVLEVSAAALARRLAGEGTSFRELLSARRMEVAERLLREGGRPIGEIALALGYAENASFSRAFRRRFGVTAERWRTKR